jgi:hypothetical protein
MTGGGVAAVTSYEWLSDEYSAYSATEHCGNAALGYSTQNETRLGCSTVCHTRPRAWSNCAISMRYS